mmetsp:Transcript_28766/g.82336  ORF Transcript_28766/g.82336 Transcript_28766/m.82336 type:complete len:366 (+) Transcript_28766:127-1224(+)
MVGGEAEDRGGEQWIFTEEALAGARAAAQDCAARALQSSVADGGERRASSREPPRPLGLEEGLRLVLFYARKVPELCDLCEAPADVRWTAAMFYRRFFAVRSPMEFDPLPLMFACVHAACKVEEVHEITLERLLAAADLSADESLKARVVRFELPLLEGLGFGLLVEPKPHTALGMLAEELRAKRPASLAALQDDGWREALARAESLVLQMAVRSDAVLRWPISVVIAAALGATLDARISHPSDDRANAPSQLSLALLQSSLEADEQKKAIAGMYAGVVHCIQQLASEPELTEDAVKETVKNARKCHRAFERLRELATESNEAQRKERKRRLSEVKGASQRVPTPMLRDLMEFNRRMQAGSGSAA